MRLRSCTRFKGQVQKQDALFVDENTSAERKASCCSVDLQVTNALFTLFRIEAVYRPIFALANGLQTNRIHTEQELGVTKRNSHCATIVGQRTAPCNRTT